MQSVALFSHLYLCDLVQLTPGGMATINVNVTSELFSGFTVDVPVTGTIKDLYTAISLKCGFSNLQVKLDSPRVLLSPKSAVQDSELMKSDNPTVYVLKRSSITAAQKVVKRVIAGQQSIYSKHREEVQQILEHHGSKLDTVADGQKQLLDVMECNVTPELKDKSRAELKAIEKQMQNNKDYQNQQLRRVKQALLEKDDERKQEALDIERMQAEAEKARADESAARALAELATAKSREVADLKTIETLTAANANLDSEIRQAACEKARADLALLKEENNRLSQRSRAKELALELEKERNAAAKVAEDKAARRAAARSERASKLRQTAGAPTVAEVQILGYGSGIDLTAQVIAGRRAVETK